MQLSVNYIKSVLTVYDEMVNNGFSLVYLGEFSHEITKMFTRMAEDDMERKSEERAIMKKVYHVMVETLQNMNKHSDEITDTNIGNGLFMIGKKDGVYYIITSNKVTFPKMEKLKSALDEVNQATPEELKKMYMKQIKEGSLSDKGGAGLGLIDIARKTGKKMDYQFLPYDEKYVFFILKTEIDSNPSVSE